MTKNIPAFISLVTILVSASLWSSVSAVDWTVTPTATIREVYSDNITLAPNNEQSEFATEVNPGLSILGQGQRVNLSADYNLQVILFPSGDFDNEINHRLNSTVTGELIRELLFLDVDGSIFQTNANNTGRRAADNIAQTGNTIDTYVYRVSPYLRKRFGSFAQGEVRYAFGEVINEGATVDSEAHGAKFQIDSGTQFSRLPWQLFGESRNVDFDDGTETEYWQTGGEVRYIIGFSIGVFGRGGYEFQDFGTAREDVEDFFWQTGVTWTPSPRTKFKGGYGKRFFGKNFFFTFEHTSRRTKFDASFSEDVTLTNENLANRLVAGTQIQIPTNQATPTSEVLVTQRFDGTITFTGRRTNIGVTGFHESRDFQDTGDNETVFGISATVRRNLSQRMSIGMFVQWDETMFRDGIREDTRWEGKVSLNRSLGPNSNGSIEYRYTDQDSNSPLNEFQENRFSIGLSVTF